MSDKICEIKVYKSDDTLVYRLLVNSCDGGDLPVRVVPEGIWCEGVIVEDGRIEVRTLDPPKPELPEVEVFDAIPAGRTKHNRYIRVGDGMWLVTADTKSRTMLQRCMGTGNYGLTDIRPVTPPQVALDSRTLDLCIDAADFAREYARDDKYKGLPVTLCGRSETRWKRMQTRWR